MRHSRDAASLLPWLAAGAFGVVILVVLSATGSPAPVQGQPQPSLTPEARIAIPGSRVLQPGEQTTFYYPPPTPAPGSTPTPFSRAIFLTVDLTVQNDTDEQIFVLDDGESFVVTGYADELLQLSSRN